MRVEFKQGVPKECIAWLWDNVGSGNVKHEPNGTSIRGNYIEDRDLWFFERIEKITLNERFYPDVSYVPTITVTDPRLATLIALRWSS